MYTKLTCKFELLLSSEIFITYQSSSTFRGTQEFLDCEIIAIKPKYFPRPRAWAFPKHSPYLKLFDFYIRNFIEKGKYKALEARYQKGKQKCQDLGGLPIDFRICVTAFLILVSGFFLSFISLLTEFTVPITKSNCVVAYKCPTCKQKLH